MAERSKAAVLKTVSGVTHSGVRIPLPPPLYKVGRARKLGAEELVDQWSVQFLSGKREEVTTMTNLERIRKELSPARRKKVEARAAQLIAEEMTLQELRHARKLTQVRMAKALGIGQDGVSKIEKRADLMISTLRKTVEAMGGTLSLVAEFPDREPVVLSASLRKNRSR